MSKKRIIAMFVCLCIIVLLCVLGGVVFVVSDIEIERQDENLKLNSTITDESIIEKSNIEFNKSIFAISESKVVSNIETNFPILRVVGIERRFPNKIVIKVTERVPLVAIKYKNKPEYLVLDNNMCAIKKVNEKDEVLKNLSKVEGYELVSENTIYLGEQLPATYGQEVVIIQHIFAGLQQKMSVTKINDFVKSIYFVKKTESVYVSTKYGNEGVAIRINYKNMHDDKQLVYNQIQMAYESYTKLYTEQKQSGYLVYDEELRTFKHIVKDFD